MTTTKHRRGWGTGRLFKRPRSPFWYIRWYDLSGKRRSKATRTTSKAEAERILRAELEAKSRGENPDTRKVTFAMLERLLLDDHAVRGRRSQPKLKHLRTAFGSARAVHITGAAVRQYERHRLDAGAARATVNNELAALRRMYRLAIEHRLLTRDQVPTIPHAGPAERPDGLLRAGRV